MRSSCQEGKGPSLANELLLSAENYIWGLQGICQLHRIPFAPDLVLQQFPPPYSLLTLEQAVKALGLNSGLREASVAELPPLPTPYVAVLTPAPSSTSAAAGENSSTPREHASSHRLAIVVKCDAYGIRFHETSARGVNESIH